MNALVFLAVSVATVAAIPSGLIFQQPYTAGRVVYNTPAVTLPAAVGPATPTKTGLATVNTDSAAVVPDIPGLDGVQKELLGLVASVQPEITAQLARIGANIGAWAALNAAGSSVDLARLPPVINDQMQSITLSGQRLLGAMERMLAEIWPEVDNMAAVSNSLLDQIPAAMQFVPVELRGQILELTDATNKIATLMQSLNPQLKALATQSLATQKAQNANNIAKIAGAQAIQRTPAVATGVYYG